MRDPDPLEERVRGRALHPVRAGLDRLDREHEVAEHESREEQRPACRHEQEERARSEPRDEHHVVEARQRDRVLHVPERDHHQRVGAHLELEEALEGDQRGQEGGDRRGDHGEQSRPTGAAVDPDEQGDQQERRDDEHVSLLDRAREARCERGDHEQRPAPEREGGDDELLRPRIEGASADGEEDERGDGEDADVEIELGEVPEEEAQHLGEVVALLADDGIGAEEALERGAPGELSAEREHGASGDDRVERQKRA